MSRAVSTSSRDGGLKSNENISPLTGKSAPQEMLVDLACLERDYFGLLPEVDDPNQLISFGTSGHNGSSQWFHSTKLTFLFTQAICDYRRNQRIDGPLFMGKDIHALSRPAKNNALAARDS